MTSSENYKFAIVACARWEADSILEWMTYYKIIGVDHIYLYCNDDDPRELYEAVLPYLLGEKPFVTFHHFGIQGQQESMYIHFFKNYRKNCDYFGMIDIDEFILMRKYDKIADFIESFDSNVDAIHLNSVTAGHCGHIDRPRGYAIKNFTRRTNEVSLFTKAIVKSAAVSEEKFGTCLLSAFYHNVSDIMYDDSIIVNVLNQDMKYFYKAIDENGSKLKSIENFDKKIIDNAFLYHIAMKSENDLVRRYERGTGGNQLIQSEWMDLYRRGRHEVKDYLDKHNLYFEPRLLEIWNRATARSLDHQIIGAPPGRNIALKKPALQSSLAPWLTGTTVEDDAAKLVNGQFQGRHNHHTDHENSPWWQVDLLEILAIEYIYIYNRVDDSRDRFRNLDIFGSVDGLEWVLIHTKADDVPFGGADGHPYIFSARPPLSYRYIRIAGRGPCHLDFSQVEIYGPLV